MVVRQQRRQEASVDPDPLLWAWGPPPDETPSQRAVRKAGEKDARLTSERIDEEMRKEKQEKHHNLKKRPVEVILLGREGSGASLTPPSG
jgi:guanine nucleotide-binding protein alpha-1 subunit